jgi:hypothetical protein
LDHAELLGSSFRSSALVVKGVPDAYRMPQFRIQLNHEPIHEALSFVDSLGGNGRAGHRAAPRHRPAQRPLHRLEDAVARDPEKSLPSRRRR